MRLKLPAYVNVRKCANGTLAYYWIRPKWASPPNMRHGKLCPVESTALGTEQGRAITKAEAINAAFKEWREGSESARTPGSVKWLFTWFCKLEKFTSLRQTSRRGYRKAMDMVEAMETKAGPLGARKAAAIDATVTDALYKKARDKHGERQASYMMQVCRLVWNQAKRPGYSKTTGVKDNPFSGMGIKASSGAGKGNRAATRAEYDLYRQTAREMGKQSMATAAALCFECCQRVWDAFGFQDDDGVARGFMWQDYQPGVQIAMRQSKTEKPMTFELSTTIEGEVVPLYPELEAELARMTRADGEMIVRDERTGKPYTVDYMQKLHGKIRKKAGLPADLRFTSFRHGGITEIGDAGVDDVRPVSGHTKLDTTAIYNKANAEKARQIALKRREHVAASAGLALGNPGQRVP